MTERKVDLFRYRNLNFARRTVVSHAINDIWGLDLIDLVSKGGGYILNGIDIFSRKAHSVKLTSKSAASIEEGLEKMFVLFGDKLVKIWSDKESGLVSNSKFLTENNIELYHTENSYDGKFSNPIIERFNRTMREAMMKIKQEHPNQNFNQLAVNTIKSFIPIYNETVHRTLKATPNSVYNNVVPSEKNYMDNLERADETRKQPVKKWNVGDKVHVANPKEKSRINGRRNGGRYRTRSLR